MEEQAKPKKKGGRPWTEAEKQARRELNAKKREQRKAEQEEAERKFIQSRMQNKEAEEKPKKKPMGRPKGSHWSPEQRAKQMAYYAKKTAERDAALKAYAEANPQMSKKELGIDRHWKPKDGSIVNYGYNLRYARVAQELPPINIKNPEQVQQRINDYFDFCQETNKPPNKTGLANWLGVNYGTLGSWRRGEVSKETTAPIIQKALMIIEDSLVSQVQMENKNPAGGIFLLKSTCGYREQQEFFVHTENDNETELSADEIEKRYLVDGKTVETTFKEDE